MHLADFRWGADDELRGGDSLTFAGLQRARTVEVRDCRAKRGEPVDDRLSLDLGVKIEKGDVSACLGEVMVRGERWVLEHSW